MTKSDKGLIELARQSLINAFEESEIDEPVFSEDSERVSGVFITLFQNDNLRGCKGCVEGDFPLRSTIWEIARSSAFGDSRFTPLTKEELKGLEISVSLLGPMERLSVENPSQYKEHLKVGRDGICLRFTGNSALFLPEVALEQAWDIETTLSRLCLKAGLEEDDWHNPEMEVLRFQTEHLEE